MNDSLTQYKLSRVIFKIVLCDATCYEIVVKTNVRKCSLL